MPTGKEPGLDGRHWQDLDPNTAIAQRRDSTTGIEARSYLQATTPKIESTTKETKPDLGVLTLIQRPGESKEEYLSRLSSFAPVAEKEKMEPEDGIVGKADTGGMKVKKEKVGKAEAGSAAILFDKKLFYVLTTILRLQLDD